MLGHVDAVRRLLGLRGEQLDVLPWRAYQCLKPIREGAGHPVAEPFRDDARRVRLILARDVCGDTVRQLAQLMLGHTGQFGDIRDGGAAGEFVANGANSGLDDRPWNVLGKVVWCPHEDLRGGLFAADDRGEAQLGNRPRYLIAALV